MNTELSPSIWLKFQEMYRLGGDNVAEIDVASCLATNAESVANVLRRHAEVLSVTRDGDDCPVSSLPEQLRRVAKLAEATVGAVLRWRGQILWMQSFQSGLRPGSLDIQLIYKGPAKFMEDGACESDSRDRLTYFVQLGLDVCAKRVRAWLRESTARRYSQDKNSLRMGSFWVEVPIGSDEMAGWRDGSDGRSVPPLGRRSFGEDNDAQASFGDGAR
jgi:hypothetical protein